MCLNRDNFNIYIKKSWRDNDEHTKNFTINNQFTGDYINDYYNISKWNFGWY